MGQAIFSGHISTRCGQPHEPADGGLCPLRLARVLKGVRHVVRLALVALLSVGAQAAEPPVLPDGRGGEPPPFADVWVVDRSSSDTYRVLAALVRPDRFTAVVLTGTESPRTESLGRLLEIVPEGRSHWVSRAPVPVGLSVNRVVDPVQVIEPRQLSSVVVCTNNALLPLAALVAMRSGAVLVDAIPDGAARQVIKVGTAGQDDESEPDDAVVVLRDVQQTVDFLNARATRSAVMVYKVGTLLPEHVLYAFQRGLLLVQVDPPPYSGEDVGSEVAATQVVAAQIRAAVSTLPELGGRMPEALVIAGDWTQIPYRFARATADGWIECPGCENGIRTFAADAEYANLDGDPWGEPEVASGRLLSYDRDLLALQTVVGVWRDLGAFDTASRATFLGVIPSSLRDLTAQGWREALWDRQWQVYGPEAGEEYNKFRFDASEFLYFADDSDVVVVQAHGAPNLLRDDRRLLDGDILASTARSARPAFWFMAACATARHIVTPYGSASPHGNANLVSGLQSRLVLGALMTVELTASPVGSMFWPPQVLERGVPVGELVRRSWVLAISAYRGDPGAPAIPAGMAQRSRMDVNLSNAWVAGMWVGDPLTVF